MVGGEGRGSGGRALARGSGCPGSSPPSSANNSNRNHNS